MPICRQIGATEDAASRCVTPDRRSGSLSGQAPTRPKTEALARAAARLNRLDLYPEPVRVARVRLWTTPLLFRLPWFRRFDGYAAWNTILLREPVAQAGDDLLVHELCHVWQMQHRPLAMPLSYLRQGYAANPYELEARRAVEKTTGALS